MNDNFLYHKFTFENMMFGLNEVKREFVIQHVFMDGENNRIDWDTSA